jgi:hypothetical protein
VLTATHAPTPACHGRPAISRRARRHITLRPRATDFLWVVIVPTVIQQSPGHHSPPYTRRTPRRPGAGKVEEQTRGPADDSVSSVSFPAPTGREYHRAPFCQERKAA